jgi:hypothetical protein
VMVGCHLDPLKPMTLTAGALGARPGSRPFFRAGQFRISGEWQKRQRPAAVSSSGRESSQ